MTVQIQPAQIAHCADYADLIGSQLGEGYITADDFADFLAQPENTAFEAVQNGEVRGVITAMVLPQAEAFAVLKCGLADCPDYVLRADKIGIYKTIAVSPKAQGLGIGSKLTERLLAAFAEQGLTAAACVAWQAGDTENIGGMMKKFGFTRHQSIPDYWKDDGDSFICPACGAPPCRCTANIYFKAL